MRVATFQSAYLAGNARARRLGAAALAIRTVLAAGIAACASTDPGGPASGRVPLTQLGAATYKGFAGGLYPGGVNAEPAPHAAAGLTRAQSLTPLDTAGNPSPTGKIVLVSVGMSNTTQEFCSGASTTTNCSSWTFMGQAQPMSASIAPLSRS